MKIATYDKSQSRAGGRRVSRAICLIAPLLAWNSAQGAITVTFSPAPGSPDEIAYVVAGSDVWNGGSLSSTNDNAARIPSLDSGSAKWGFTDDDPWNDIVPFSSDIGVVPLTVGSTFEMYVDGNQITNTAGVLTGSDLRIDGDPTGEFTILPPTGPSFWEYPALSGGESLVWTGSGSFIVPGGLTGNMNLGTFSYADSSGITFQAIVIPEPSSAILLGLAIVPLCLVRRRRS